MNKFIVITTINDPGKVIENFKQHLSEWKLIIVCDLKTPSFGGNHDNVEVLTVETQKKLKYKICNLPYNHYCRKMIGYMHAIKQGAEIIYDTDDDTFCDKITYPDFAGEFDIIKSNTHHFINALPLFNSRNEYIWPRGYPLHLLNKNQEITFNLSNADIGIWQGLINKDSDVDAIYRMTIHKEVKFLTGRPLVIDFGKYHPCNSQCTFFTKDTFQYMYLPAFVNFRFTDILRGYVAQYLMHDKNLQLGIFNNSAYQIRNEHDIYNDFIDEIPMYTSVPWLPSNFSGKNLFDVYNKLYYSGIVRDEELKMIENWLMDLK